MIVDCTAGKERIKATAECNNLSKRVEQLKVAFAKREEMLEIEIGR